MNDLMTGNVKTMTLKEITDLIGVQHSKAMAKVLKMAEAPEFGAVSKTDTVYNELGQTVETLVLDKRQSVAVASTLNTALLMRVIDRWTELEESKPAWMTNLSPQAVIMLEDLSSQLEAAKPKLEYHDKVLATSNGLTTTEIAAELGMSAIKLNSTLKDIKIQRKVGKRWVLTAANLNQGLATEETHIDEGGKSRHSMKWTEAGRKLIHELING
jgi:phage antirepressor YoqD-like protein